VVLFGSILLSHSKTVNAKVISFPDLYTKRSNQKALQFWRVVNRLNIWKTSKSVFWYPSARPRAFARFAEWLIRPCSRDNLWRQNTHYFLFSDWKCTTCDVIFMDWATKWQGVFAWKWQWCSRDRNLRDRDLVKISRRDRDSSKTPRPRAGLRGAMEAIAPGLPLQGPPPVMKFICFK